MWCLPLSATTEAAKRHSPTGCKRHGCIRNSRNSTANLRNMTEDPESLEKSIAEKRVLMCLLAQSAIAIYSPLYLVGGYRWVVLESRWRLSAGQQVSISIYSCQCSRFLSNSVHNLGPNSILIILRSIGQHVDHNTVSVPQITASPRRSAAGTCERN